MRLYAEGQNEKRLYEREQTAWLAWHGAMFQRAAKLPEYREIQRRLGLVKEAPLDERLKAALMAFKPKSATEASAAE